MNEEKILRLFHTLHACPEMSGKEDKTRKILLDFLKDNTSLEIRDWGSGFYAAHTEKNGASGNGKENGGIALRADFDALLMPDGCAKHLCGHDGHAAALCETALRLKGRIVGRNVYFLFQPAEETGEGAEKCLDIFREENISEIYGCHNLPGIPFGKVVTRPGTFACGSLGLTLTFTGKPAHAAYPENGISPAHAVGELLELFTRQDQTASYKGMVLCTVAGVSMGEKAFGKSAADAEIWLTLRAGHEEDLLKLKKEVIRAARTAAKRGNLKFRAKEQDVFPATENDAACAEKILKACGGSLLPVPMRWSEDFGHYLLKCRGAYFGIGAGETCAPLHTEGYAYPEELLHLTADAFMKIILSSAVIQQTGNLSSLHA